MNKIAKCKVYWKSGKHETDTLGLTSPTGNFKSLWRHSKIVAYLLDKDPKRYELYTSLLKKVYENTPFNGQIIEVTYPEMEVFSYMCNHQKDNLKYVWASTNGDEFKARPRIWSDDADAPEWFKLK